MNFTHLNLKISHNLTIFKKSYSCIFFTQTNLIGEISLYVYHFLIFYKNTPVADTLCQPKFRKKQCLTEALTKGRVFFFWEISKNLLHSAFKSIAALGLQFNHCYFQLDAVLYFKATLVISWATFSFFLLNIFSV